MHYRSEQLSLFPERDTRGGVFNEHDYFYSDDDSNEWTLNGNALSRPRGERIFDWIDSNLRKRLVCPYCQSRLAKDKLAAYFDHDRGIEVVAPEPEVSEVSEAEVLASLALCPRCWYWHWHSGGTLGYVCTWDAAVAKVRSFDPEAPPGCMRELAMHLRQDQSRWNALEPHFLEQVVAAVWRQNYAHAEVLHVGRPNDGGADVLFVDSGRQWLIQVKRRARAAVGEGVSTVRNLLGAMHLHATTFGIVVSTADHFTHHANQAAKRSRSLGMTLELVDRGKLDRMLVGFHPNFPWMAFVEQNYPSYAEYFSVRGYGPYPLR